MGAAYGAGARATLQVLALVGQPFDRSPGAQRGITITLGPGFFVALVLAPKT
jgi:hypothetical protein